MDYQCDGRIEEQNFDSNSVTSTPVIRTGVYPHMPIVRPVCHTWLYGCPMHYRFSYFGLGGSPLGQISPNVVEACSRRLSANPQNFSPIAQTVYACALPNFFTFGLRANRSSPKGEMTCYPSRSTILPNFIALRQPAPEISVTKICGQTLTDRNSKR